MSKATRIKTPILIILLAVFLFSAAMTVRQQLQYRQIDADSLEAARIAGLNRQEAAPRRSAAPRPSEAPRPSAAASASEQPEPLPEEAAELLSIDLEALRDINEDVVGWITIPGTELSYPLVQGADNQYYLSHSWKREASSGGAVFLEVTSSRDLSDFHTIVYAHQMRNDSMFGSLKYYNSLDYLREHPSIYLAAGGAIYRYDIFSAQKAGIKSMVYRLDLEEKHLENEFFQWCLDNSVIDTGLNPSAGDQVLTLSTCVGNDRANRWVVSAVLRNVWEAA